MLAHFFDPYVKESLKRVYRQALLGVASKGRKLTQATKDKISEKAKEREERKRREVTQ